MDAKWLRGPSLVITAAVVLLLSTVSAAGANSRGIWQLLNANNCGGTCNLRGVRAEISWPTKFNIVENQLGNEDIALADGGSAAGATAGGAQINDTVFGQDCNKTDTAGVLYNYWEVIHQNGVGDCTIGTSDVGSSTVVYRIQRRPSSDCSASRCIGVWVGGNYKNSQSVVDDVMHHILAQGELDRDFVDGSGNNYYNSNTLVKGTWPGAGTVRWQRTSDLDNGSTTWTTVGSAQCGFDGPAFKWDVGDLTGGFVIAFDSSGGSCP